MSDTFHNRVVVVKVAFLEALVCAPKEWEGERAAKEAEAASPCGTEKGWTVSERSLASNGCRCDRFKERKHWVLDA